MKVCCSQDDRRDEVRKTSGRNGLDYIEVSPDQLILYVYFLGKLPPELREDKPEIDRYLKIEGGQRVTDIKITDVDPVINPDPELDDYLVVNLDKYGDFSTYTVRLIGVENIDPHYDRVEFTFKIDCPSDLDCLPACGCEPEVFDEPQIDYLGKDYQSFRQVILDRLAVVMPNWTERHVPDLGVALVELLAYTGDYLSYYQDAVATEAYIDTARQRISVQRHARLVDYRLHEGCNARAWVNISVSVDQKLEPRNTAFITGMNQALLAPQNVLTWEDIREVPKEAYEVFEPLVWSTPIQLYAAHNELRFYTWGNTQCCLGRGSTTATLIDTWLPPKKKARKGKQQSAEDAYKNKPEQETKGQLERSLKLAPGDVLILEEVLGPVTGLPADADPAHRHPVRLTRVTPGEDPLIRTKDGQPTPLVHIEWSHEDKLPFPLCLSAIGTAPECRYLENISVAHGNTLLVDHGKTEEPEPLGPVATLATETTCECVGEPTDIRIVPEKFTAQLGKIPLTFSTPLSFTKWKGAASLTTQDVRSALPQVSLNSKPEVTWRPRHDVLGSSADEGDFVVEIDNDGVAHLRFGDGELGYQPPPGTTFTATYRTGNGVAGNVGAESISRLVLKNERLSGVSVSVRNPLPARGGTDAEPLTEGKLFAPFWFRKQIERAIIARDYEDIAERDRRLHQASGALVWTGSWYEADVAVDPLGREDADESLLKGIAYYLERYRRMGHDVAVLRARYIPLKLTLEVCALPHYQRGHVKAALLDVFSNRVLPFGRRGFFHPDNLTFGDGIYLSQIIAAGQAVPGVECVRVVEFHRLFESPNHELENGLLPLSVSEIAQLDNDPSYPERGQLEIQMAGGR